MTFSFLPLLKLWKSYESIAGSGDTGIGSADAPSVSARRSLHALDTALSVLEPHEKQLLTSFYHDKKSVDLICLEQGYSRSQYFRIRKNALLRMEIFAYLLQD